jgi:hypothetical protein
MEIIPPMALAPAGDLNHRLMQMGWLLIVDVGIDVDRDPLIAKGRDGLNLQIFGERRAAVSADFLEEGSLDGESSPADRGVEVEQILRPLPEAIANPVRGKIAAGDDRVAVFAIEITLDQDRLVLAFEALALGVDLVQNRRIDEVIGVQNHEKIIFIVELALAFELGNAPAEGVGFALEVRIVNMAFKDVEILFVRLKTSLLDLVRRMVGAIVGDEIDIIKFGVVGDFGVILHRRPNHCLFIMAGHENAELGLRSGARVFLLVKNHPDQRQDEVINRNARKGVKTYGGDNIESFHKPSLILSAEFSRRLGAKNPNF